MLLFVCAERVALGYPVPFLQAATAAGCRRVLCDEDRVVTHRSLFPIIGRISRRQSFLDKVRRVLENDIQPFAVEIVKLPAAQSESPAEGRPLQSCKYLVEIPVHDIRASRP